MASISTCEPELYSPEPNSVPCSPCNSTEYTIGEVSATNRVSDVTFIVLTDSNTPSDQLKN